MPYKIEMTDSQKAEALLVYLEDFDSVTVINLLHPYLTNEQLADLYDKLKREGEI